MKKQKLINEKLKDEFKSIRTKQSESDQISNISDIVKRITKSITDKDLKEISRRLTQEDLTAINKIVKLIENKEKSKRIENEEIDNEENNVKDDVQMYIKISDSESDNESKDYVSCESDSSVSSNSESSESESSESEINSEDDASITKTINGVERSYALMQKNKSIEMYEKLTKKYGIEKTIGPLFDGDLTDNEFERRKSIYDEHYKCSGKLFYLPIIDWMYRSIYNSCN